MQIPRPHHTTTRPRFVSRKGDEIHREWYNGAVARTSESVVQQPMIKKIHYCWFGGPLPANVAANVETWRRLNPDFELCEWNEGNTDVSAWEFGRRALQNKRWGFVSDIVRLQALHAHGGVYLDTDVELIHPLSTLEPEGDFLVLGYIFNCALGTAVLSSPPRHPLLPELLAEYHCVRPEAWPVNNSVFTDFFINRVPGFLLNGRRWVSGSSRVSVYPKEYFEQPAFTRERGVAIHHCSGSWMQKNAGTGFKTEGRGDPHKVKWLKRQVRTFVNCLRSPYRAAHLQALCGRRVPQVSAWRSSAGSDHD